MPISQDVKDAMRETNDLFHTQVIQQRNIAALDQVYTSDARVLPPGAGMVNGLAQIKSFWQEALTGLGLQGAVLETVHAEPCGDQVIEIGKANLSLEGGRSLAIKYVVYWKQEQGRWKWAIDIWNPNQ